MSYSFENSDTSLPRHLTNSPAADQRNSSIEFVFIIFLVGQPNHIWLRMWFDRRADFFSFQRRTTHTCSINLDFLKTIRAKQKCFSPFFVCFYKTESFENVFEYSVFIKVHLDLHWILKNPFSVDENSCCHGFLLLWAKSPVWIVISSRFVVWITTTSGTSNKIISLQTTNLKSRVNKVHPAKQVLATTNPHCRCAHIHTSIEAMAEKTCVATHKRILPKNFPTNFFAGGCWRQVQKDKMRTEKEGSKTRPTRSRHVQRRELRRFRSAASFLSCAAWRTQRVHTHSCG